MPKDVAEVVKAVAQRRGKSVEQLLVDAVLRELDPQERAGVYLRLAEKYLAEAEELYARGDLVQAGEKYWGAVVALLSAVAEKRGMPHYTHRDLWEVVEALVEETGDPEYSTLFSIAEKLHANFYHNFLKKPSFDRHREGALRLVEMLKRLAA